MADKKISELAAITGSATAADDYFILVDTSGAATKKISRAELNNAIEADVLSTVNIDGGTIDGTVIGGAVRAAGSFTDINVFPANGSTSTTAIDLGVGRSGNGYAFLDLIGDATYTDYGLRVIRNNTGANTTSSITHRGTGTFSLVAAEAAALAFYTTNAERIRLTSAGLCGLGTTAPATKLDVVTAGDNTITSRSTGGAGLFHATGVANAYTGFHINSVSTNLWSIQTRGDTNLHLFRASGSGNVIVDSGKVGIGTNSPTGNLDLFTNVTASTMSPLTFSANNASSAKKDYVQFVPDIQFNTASSEAGGYTLKVLQQGAYKNSIVASGITNNSSNYLAFSTTSEAIRITSAGLVGFGTTAPGAKLSVYAGNIGVDGNGSANQFYGAAGNIAGTNTTGGVLTVLGHSPNATGDLAAPPWNGSNFVGAAGLIARGFSESSQYRGSLEFFTKTASAANATSRMLITHDGSVVIGPTNGTVILAPGGAGGGSILVFNKPNTGATNVVLNYYGSTYVGGINMDNTSTAFLTSSDERLKENITDSPSSIESIIDIKIRSFDWINDSSSQIYGIIAQEVKLIAPECVSEGQTPEDTWGVDYSKLTPRLIKAIQEQQATIEALTARITALEG